MREKFQAVCYQLFKSGNEYGALPVFDPAAQMTETTGSDPEVARRLNAAFLALLAGTKHPQFKKAEALLNQLAESADWEKIAQFYLAAKESIDQEIDQTCNQDHGFADRLKHLSLLLENSDQRKNLSKVTENIWSVFFPEGTGLSSKPIDSIKQLREKRTVTISRLNPAPIIDPASEILFTSNVLLTLPSNSRSYEKMTSSEELKQKIRQVSREPQRYWYDHPIHIGVKPENNELLYGLHGLDETLQFERERGTTAPNSRMTCILSVSVTHLGLHDIALPYIEEELFCSDVLKNIDLYVFTEDDTQRIVAEILVPAAGHLLEQQPAESDLTMFGVDGEYGRHYSFLKAMAAFWNVFIQPQVKATFKIDLDQVFPQKVLVEQIGASAFELFTTPLWGSHGTDSRGRPLELGMIAGALVNESDIANSLFTPDVRFPQRSLEPDEVIFFSTLPQAISTEAEMMTRYDTSRFDGVHSCIQRVHVTGGTNGIRVDSLRRHRPFTPSFIGRAEDQAYLLSALKSSDECLAYVHSQGLIMRHDKEAFAQEAIKSAKIGTTVGDYVRILYFSAYARALSEKVETLKDTLDPFTGCFISKIPVTVALLRFALKAASLFRDNEDDKGFELINNGTQRISEALKFTRGKDSPLKKQYEKERRGWDLYYDTIDALEQAIRNKDPFALQLQQKARDIIDDCKVAPQGRVF